MFAVVVVEEKRHELSKFRFIVFCPFGGSRNVQISSLPFPPLCLLALNALGFKAPDCSTAPISVLRGPSIP